MVCLVSLDHGVRLASLAHKDSWASLAHLVLLALMEFPALLDSRARKVQLEYLDCLAGQVTFLAYFRQLLLLTVAGNKEFNYQLVTIINTKNCSLSIVLTATDQKPQKSLKR